MDVLWQFTFTIIYCPGKSNQNADALSCQAWIDDRPAQDSLEEEEMLGPPNTPSGLKSTEHVPLLEAYLIW